MFSTDSELTSSPTKSVCTKPSIKYRILSPLFEPKLWMISSALTKHFLIIDEHFRCRFSLADCRVAAD